MTDNLSPEIEAYREIALDFRRRSQEAYRTSLIYFTGVGVTGIGALVAGEQLPNDAAKLGLALGTIAVARVVFRAGRNALHHASNLDEECSRYIDLSRGQNDQPAPPPTYTS